MIRNRGTGRILVTGTRSGNAPDVVTALDTLGFDVAKSSPAESVVERVRDGGIEVVVLGPEMAPSVAERLRHNMQLDPSTRHVPVLKVTDEQSLETELRQGAVSADDILVAPFADAELLMRTRNLMRLRAMHEELALKIQELEGTKSWLVELANTDSLTSLYNRRYLEEFTHREIKRSRRYGRILSVVMADVDHFKSVNDSCGHQAGDQLLRDIGLLLRDSVRNVDLPARYGGEEFALVLPETDKAGATLVAERVRQQVETYNETNRRPIAGRAITMSLGVATFPEDATEMEQLVNVADRRLYRAKADGRNCVIATDATDPEMA